MVELDRLVFLELRLRRTKIENWWRDVGIVELEWHNPRTDRRNRVRVKRGEGRSDVAHVRGSDGGFGG